MAHSLSFLSLGPQEWQHWASHCKGCELPPLPRARQKKAQEQGARLGQEWRDETTIFLSQCTKDGSWNGGELDACAGSWLPPQLEQAEISWL